MRKYGPLLVIGTLGLLVALPIVSGFWSSRTDVDTVPVIEYTPVPGGAEIAPSPPSSDVPPEPKVGRVDRPEPDRQIVGRTGSSGTLAVPFGWVFAIFPVLIMLVPILVALHAARDMDSRGQNGWLYALLVLFAFPVGVILWLILRQDKPVLYPPVRRFSDTQREGLWIAGLALAAAVVLVTMAYSGYERHCVEILEAGAVTERCSETAPNTVLLVLAGATAAGGISFGAYRFTRSGSPDPEPDREPVSS